MYIPIHYDTIILYEFVNQKIMILCDIADLGKPINNFNR